MFNKRYISIIAILSIIALAGLIARIQSGDQTSSQHRATIGLLADLQHNDILLNESLIMANSSLLSSYDPLVEISSQIKVLLNNVREGIEQSDDISIDNELNGLYNEKFQQIERYKSSLSIFKNSLKALPSLLESIKKESNKHIPVYNEVLIQTLAYINTPTASDKGYLLEAVKSMPVETKKQKRFNYHALNVIQLHSQVSEDLKQILSIKTEAKIGKIGHAYNALYIKKNQQANIWIIGLSLLVFVLFAFLMRMLFLLNRKNEEVLSMNKSLDIKVQERTKELEEKNIQLLDTKKDLELAFHEVRASEEELRQNSEELRAINDSLKLTNQRLKDTQSQLVQSEKMAGLGQMTAGIAHEINNPVNFIAGGIQILDSLIPNILKLLGLYRGVEPQLPEDLALLTEIQAVKEELVMEELAEDLEMTLQDMRLGVERTTTIVQGLKYFARQDAEKSQMADIHEGLEASLTILHNKYKGRIEIHKHYAPNMHPVECYVGQINQVFVNLIGNAIDAIEDKGDIHILTQDEGSFVSIRIKDTGKGIPSEVLDNIFEPFFTTKDVGKGTGLGLSITHGIIEKHQGSIQVESKEGHGSTFTITLPKRLS